MKRHPIHLRLVATAALALVNAACGPDIPPPKPLVVQKEAAAVDTAADTPMPDEEDVVYIYSPVGKRDPFFNPTGSVAGTVAIGPADPDRPLEPLQKFEIDRLKLKFTITGSSTPLAMIIDPKGDAHPARIGSWVGKNWGKVSHIGREEITITETIADRVTGRVYPQYIPMRMPKTDEEIRLEKSLENTGESL